MFDIPKAGLKTLNHRGDWTTARLKFLFKRETRRVLEIDEVVTAFRDGMVTLRKNRRDDGFTFAEKEIGYQGIEPGDLVIHAMDGFAGAIGVSDSRGKGSPVLSIVTPISDAEPRFWAYYLRNLAVTGFIQSLAKGIRERSTDFRWKDASNLLVNFPDLSTQREIADFLDRETARIDLLIEKKQNLVKLLGEKRSITVTEAVTGVTNRGSAEGGGGVLRTRFETAPLRRHIDKMTNGTAATQLEEDETTYKVTRIETISAGTINLEKTGSVNGNEDLRQFALRNGDILFSHINSMSVIGNSALVTSKVLPLYVGMNLLRIRPSSAVKSEFLAWCLKSDFIRHQVRQFAKPAINQASISTTNLKRVMAPLPDLSTQREIADFLDRETVKIDAVKEKTLSSIDRLKECRSALITAAVTGQVDVTTYAKSGTTDRRFDTIHEKMG